MAENPPEIPAWAKARAIELWDAEPRETHDIRDAFARYIAQHEDAPVMTKYRKKPVEIEAVQFDAIENVDDGAEPMFNGSFAAPDWIADALGAREGTAGSMWIDWEQGDEPVLLIGTLEGTHRADRGDWIIRGIKGEIYPCAPDIFAATYEAVS